MSKLRWLFQVKAKPIGKGRPRFSVVNGERRVYTPRATKRFENAIAIEARLAGCQPGLGVVSLDIVAQFAPSASTARRRNPPRVGSPRPIKPDLSNVIKAIEDALNGIAYNDDSQVCTLHARKQYGPDDLVIVTVERIEP